MNWITKFIKPKIKSLFKKRSSKIKENLWTTCECKNLIYKEDLLSNLKCCPKCGAHHKLSCEERFQTFFDNKEYEIQTIDGVANVLATFSEPGEYVVRMQTIDTIAAFEFYCCHTNAYFHINVSN